MFVVIETKLNQFTELPPGSTIVSTDGVQHPWQITSQWSDSELEFINVYRVEPTPIPDGKTSVDFTFSRDASGVVRQVHTLEDLPLTPVTPRQIRLALTQIGVRQAIEDWVKTQGITVQDSWQYATEVTRDNALVIAACTAVGKTEAELDALFALARTL
jgi:hypothetical protein